MNDDRSSVESAHPPQSSQSTVHSCKTNDRHRFDAIGIICLAGQVFVLTCSFILGTLPHDVTNLMNTRQAEWIVVFSIGLLAGLAVPFVFRMREPFDPQDGCANQTENGEPTVTHRKSVRNTVGIDWPAIFIVSSSVLAAAWGVCILSLQPNQSCFLQSPQGNIFLMFAVGFLPGVAIPVVCRRQA